MNSYPILIISYFSRGVCNFSRFQKIKKELMRPNMNSEISQKCSAKLKFCQNLENIIEKKKKHRKKIGNKIEQK